MSQRETAQDDQVIRKMKTQMSLRDNQNHEAWTSTFSSHYSVSENITFHVLTTKYLLHLGENMPVSCRGGIT